MVNIPNVLSALRLAVSPVLLILAMRGQPTAFLVLGLLLLFDDWIDGKLAIWLRQRTTFGARLDSVADATLYACLLVGVVVLKGAWLRGEMSWIVMPLGTYALTSISGLAKYGRLPSYHTRGAKISCLLVTLAVVAIFLWEQAAAWFFRVAMAAVTITNVEATIMTFTLPSWRADVPSLYHALRLKQDLELAGPDLSAPAGEPTHPPTDHQRKQA